LKSKGIEPLLVKLGNKKYPSKPELAKTWDLELSPSLNYR
jgi:hypothetical protein